MPTNNPSPQHYSELNYGERRILNAGDAAIEIQKEDMGMKGGKRKQQKLLGSPIKLLGSQSREQQTAKKAQAQKMEQVRKPAKKTAEDQTLPKSSSHIVLTGAQDNNLFHYNKPLSSTQKKLKTCFHLMFFNRQSRFILQGSFSIRQIQNLGEPHEYGYSRMKGSHGYGYFRIEGPHGYGYPVVKKLDGDIQGSHGFQIFGYFGQAFTSIRAG